MDTAHWPQVDSCETRVLKCAQAYSSKSQKPNNPSPDYLFSTCLSSTLLHQEIVVKPLEEILTTPQNQKKLGVGGGGGSKVSSNNNRSTSTTTDHHQKDQQSLKAILNCPRCNSTNTKFCYYNNYSLTQPRYYCKTCKRYWTEGGSLRNIPVGGGSRKNKRPAPPPPPSNSDQISSNPSKKLPPLISPPPKMSTIHQEHQQDLNLAFPRSFTELISSHHNNNNNNNNNNVSAMESSSSFMHIMPQSSYQVMQDDHEHGHQEFVKPSGLSFSLDDIGLGISNTSSNNNGGNGSSSRPFFSFEDLKNNTNHHHHNHMEKDQDHVAADSSGYWTGMLGGAGAAGGGSW